MAPGEQKTRAFFNGVFLLALALSIFLQSIERFVHVEEVSDPKLILIVGCVGLALNLISVAVVHDHHGHGHGHAIPPHNVNDGQTVELTSSHPLHATHNHTIDPPNEGSQHNLGLIGVLVHLLGDAVNNIGVIIVAIIIWKVESHSRYYSDPAASLLIALVIFGSAVPLTQRSARILLEATPKHLSLEKVKEDIMTLPLVQSVHDIHVWHLSQSVILASLHVCVPAGTTFKQWEKTEQYLQHCFAEYGIGHVTISPEIERESREPSEVSHSEEAFGGCRAPSKDGFGCSVADLKKRRSGD